jgi:hypothetical protein
MMFGLKSAPVPWIIYGISDGEGISSKVLDLIFLSALVVHHQILCAESDSVFFSDPHAMINPKIIG